MCGMRDYDLIVTCCELVVNGCDVVMQGYGLPGELLWVSCENQLWEFVAAIIECVGYVFACIVNACVCGEHVKLM